MKVGIDELLEEKNGVLRTREAIASGISKEGFYKLAKELGLEKASHGIFINPDEWADDMYLLQTQIPRVIFSHETALYLHDLSEREPDRLTVTVPAKYNNPRLLKKGVETVYVKPEWYPLGLSETMSPNGHPIAVYDMERTVCDIIRRRSSMDASTFNYALTTYMKRKDRNLSRLSAYSKEMRLEKRLWQVMGVLF